MASKFLLCPLALARSHGLSPRNCRIPPHGLERNTLENCSCSNSRGERLSGGRSGRKWQASPGTISITLDDTVYSPDGTVFIPSGSNITPVGAALGMHVAGEDTIDCRRHYLEAPESQQAAKSD